MHNNGQSTQATTHARAFLRWLNGGELRPVDWFWLGVLAATVVVNALWVIPRL